MTKKKKGGWNPEIEVFVDRPRPDWLVFALILVPAVVISALATYYGTGMVYVALLTGSLVLFGISVILFGTSYELSREKLRIFIGPFNTRSFTLSQFEHARHGYPNVINEHWTVRLSNHITLHKKNGLIRSLVITPSNPQTFLDQLRDFGIKIKKE